MAWALLLQVEPVLLEAVRKLQVHHAPWACQQTAWQRLKESVLQDWASAPEHCQQAAAEQLLVVLLGWAPFGGASSREAAQWQLLPAACWAAAVKALPARCPMQQLRVQAS